MRKPSFDLLSRVRVAFGAGVALLLAGCVTDSANAPGPSTAAAPPPPVQVGGLVGGSLGNGLSDADRKRAYDAEITALDSGGPGAPIGWRGDDGSRGTVIAGPPYSRPGYKICRDYSHTIYVQNKPQIARGASCRTEEGSWVSIS